MIFPGMQQSKTRISGASQPKLVEKATGQLFILVRDDVSVNGKLYVAPIGMMTSMTSIKPDDFKERFEWYVDPANRPIQVGPPEVDAGGAAGPFVPLSVDENFRPEYVGPESVEGQPIIEQTDIGLGVTPNPAVPDEQAAEAPDREAGDGATFRADSAVAELSEIDPVDLARAEEALRAEARSRPPAVVEAPKNKGGRPKGRKDRKKRKSPAKRARVGPEDMITSM